MAITITKLYFHIPATTASHREYNHFHLSFIFMAIFCWL